jgi:hypothetical protein
MREVVNAHKYWPENYKEKGDVGVYKEKQY